MPSLDDLLAIQELDTSVDQLRHRRSHLPQMTERRSLDAERTRSLALVEDTAGRLRALRSSQKESEDHASLLEDKATEVQASLYDGSVTSHKELESLQAEHASLKARQGEFEDTAIELMEAAEPVETELAARTAAVDALTEQIDRLDAEITVAVAEIDVQVDELLEQRSAIADGVPQDLLQAYEPLRAQLGGVAVARLSGARCEGCHLEIPSAQLEAVRRAPDDEIVSCPECLRILVR